jgi:hypothetical protein
MNTFKNCVSNCNLKIVKQRGRKRKVEEVVDPLRDKLEAAKRISKLQTTQQLALKFKIELPNNQTNHRDNNDTIQCNINNNNSFDVNINSVSQVDEQNNTKYELMQRFLSSSNPNQHEDRHQHEDEHEDQHEDQHKHHINDSIDREINDILSQLPPIHSNDLDLDSTQSQFFDHSNHSNQSFDYEFENSISNSSNNNNNSNSNEINVNNSSDNEINDFTDGLENSVLEDNRDINIRLSSVSETHVEKLNEEKWEYVNGTYDSETEWREWTQMTSAVSYNGDVLHILPYVDNNW